jgi:repressor LexA
MEPLTQAQKELYDWLIEYISETQHAPSIRQMMRAMDLRSPAPIQSRLERLRTKGYIDWTEGKARTLRILHRPAQGIPVLGTIAAGGLVEPFSDVQEKLDISALFGQANSFALRVVGDSMIEDSIVEGDMAIVRSLTSAETVKNGEIVAARVAGHGTTLKRFFQKANKIVLKPANRKYKPIEVPAEQVEIQGILIGVWRGY